MLEHEIVNILVVNFLGTRSLDENAEQLLSDPWADKFKATLGALLRQFQPYTHADPGLADDLAEALRLRNHLAHGFWRDRADDFCTDGGRARMIADLIKARRYFEDVDQRLTETIGTTALQQ